MVAHPQAELRLHGSRVQASAGDTAPLTRALEETGTSARPLFGPSEDRVRARAAASPWALPDLSTFYRLEVADQAQAEAITSRLIAEDAVAGAYVKPAPVIDRPQPAEAADMPLTRATPSFEDRQTYLEAPPGGVNARSAWTRPGGDGTSVPVVIVGGAWRLTHEELPGAAAGVIAGAPIDAVSFRNHGTAMLGIVRADRDDIGVTGIAPACQARQVATFGLGTSAAIQKAADALVPGGILYVEWQRPGPGATGVGSAGFIALEWWPDDLAAIQFAIAKGVIVVEPAGNGAVSLDDPRYDQPAPGFPQTWRNPFRRSPVDSGAILVGAGAPPPGTHGRDHGPDRSRMSFSNHGSMVDVQGWGAEITTIGYGDLQGGPDEDVWYTDVFGGTSGATAMVAGVLASLQGIQLTGGKQPPLTPAQARGMLRQTGSPQPDTPDEPTAENIGSRPELVALIALLTPSKDEAKDAKDAKDPKDHKDSKDTKDPKDGKDQPDTKQRTDKHEKEQKEHKDVKDGKGEKHESPKELKDNRGPKENRAPEQPQRVADPGVGGGPWPEASDEPVQHFIPADQRPDLSAAALIDEPDMQGRSAVELAEELRRSVVEESVH